MNYTQSHLALGTYIYSVHTFLLSQCVGKFGVVHKGKLVADDGNLKLVAIKTIKCKLSCNLQDITM